MTVAALRHPHPTVDAFSRTPGPHRVSQERIHTPLGTLPLRTPSLTQHLLDRAQLTSTHTGVTLRLLPLVIDVPQARESVSQHGLRDGRSQGCTQPIHMAQRPLIAQQALDCAPTGALQLLARLVELGLSGLTAREPPLCLKPCQSGGNLLHGLLGVPRLIEEPLGLAPGPPSHPRDPARITPLPLGPFHRGIRLTRRCALPLGVFPLTR